MWWWWGLLEGAGILHRTDFPPPFSGAAVHTLSAGRDEREILEHEPVNLRGVEKTSSMDARPQVMNVILLWPFRNQQQIL